MLKLRTSFTIVRVYGTVGTVRGVRLINNTGKIKSVQFEIGK